MSNEREQPSSSSQEEPVIEVHDRRLLSESERSGTGDDTPAEGTAQSPPPETGTDESPPSEDAEATTGEEVAGAEGEQGDEELDDVEVAGLLALYVNVLASQAWMHMGLVANPRSGVVVKDAAQARLAIDAAAALCDLLKRDLPDDDRRQLDGLLSNLRVNFVQQCGS